jgi:hypothetical protein
LSRISPAALLLLLLSGHARATLFPYSLVDAAGVPQNRCASGALADRTWPAGAGRCHDDSRIPCTADPPFHLASAGLHESIMCAHLSDSTPDAFPLGLCDMSTSNPAAICTAQSAEAVCGSGGSCSQGGCAFLGGAAHCEIPCFPFQGPDADCDGTPNSQDACPWYPSTLPEATQLADPPAPDTRAPACLCGDQAPTGVLDVSDLIAVNRAIFAPLHAHPLCDVNGDHECNVKDLVGLNTGIFDSTVTRCNRHPEPAP